MANSDIKQHVSIEERTKWNKVVEDFNVHLHNYGDDHHKRGDGINPGFSMNDYTTSEKEKLASVEWAANKYVHPTTHPVGMITGLAKVALTNSYNDLDNKPVISTDAKTVTGIRFTIGASAPASPVNNKDVWFDTANRLLKVYTGNTWIPFRAVYA